MPVDVEMEQMGLYRLAYGQHFVCRAKAILAGKRNFIRLHSITMEMRSQRATHYFRERIKE